MTVSATKASIEISSKVEKLHKKPIKKKIKIDVIDKLQKLYKKQTKKKAEFDVLDADKENFSKLRSQYAVATRKGLFKSKELIAGNAKYIKWLYNKSNLVKIEKEIKACQDEVCRG